MPEKSSYSPWQPLQCHAADVSSPADASSCSFVQWLRHAPQNPQHVLNTPKRWISPSDDTDFHMCAVHVIVDVLLGLVDILHAYSTCSTTEDKLLNITCNICPSCRRGASTCRQHNKSVWQLQGLIYCHWVTPHGSSKCQGVRAV
jgi:hypothetical protein